MKRIALIFALMATPAFAQVTADTANPLAGSADAVEAGHQLFGKMNCAGCHAYDLTGGMGPDLTDNSWQYGGKPARSITPSSKARRGACRPGKTR